MVEAVNPSLLKVSSDTYLVSSGQHLLTVDFVASKKGTRVSN